MKNKFFALFSIMFFLGFYSCKKDEINLENSSINEEKNDEQTDEGMIVLGRELQNPYSIENMNKAYKNLMYRNLVSEISIRTTNYYIRFLPKSEKELSALKSDTSLMLFDYPLLYEMEEGGVYYHDKTLPDSAITWQYTVVKENYSFPNVQYEILSDLFMPEELEETGELDEESAGNLLQEAAIITDNIEKDQKKGWFVPSKWRPQGTIKVYDDVAGIHIPLVGAKVKTRWLLRFRKGYTNENGYFSTHKFRWKVNYSIKWENNRYDIRNGSLPQAWFNGPRKKGDWNLDISSQKSLRFATIHRAAYRYFHRNIGGLKRPVPPNINMRYSYYHEEGTATSPTWLALDLTGLIPNALIYGKSPKTGSWYTTDVIFRKTIHETGHTSHIYLRGIGGTIENWQTTHQIRESWADAIEWYISKIEYDELGHVNWAMPSTTNTNASKQNWKSSDDHDYTPLFIDLVDNYNQALESGTQPTDRCPDGGTFNAFNFCHVANSPSDTQAFIYADNFFYTSNEDCECPIGDYYDGQNCYFMDIPDNSIGIIYENAFYLTPSVNPNFPNDYISNYKWDN